MKCVKVLLSVLLGIALVTGVFAGGGQQGAANKPDDGKKLMFWSFLGGADAAYIDQILVDYNNSGPTKQIESIMIDQSEYYTKLPVAVAAGQGPDIGMSHAARLPRMVEDGIVIALDDYAAKAGVNWNDYSPAMNEGITFSGKKYAVPLDNHGVIMYVNVDKLKAAGVPVNSSNQISVGSAADFKAIMDKIKPTLPADETVLSLPQTGGNARAAWWATYFQMGGTQLVNAAGTQVTFDKAIAARAMDYVKSLWTDGYILPGIQNQSTVFSSQKAALVFSGTWLTGSFSNTAGLNFGAQPFPRLFGTNDALYMDAHVFTIPTNRFRSAADTQAGVEFIYWVSTKGGPTWAQSGQIPASLTVQSSPAFTALPRRADYAKAASTAVFPIKNVNTGAFLDLLSKNLDLVWNNQATSAVAAQNIADEIQELLKN
ncbi:sugar ABC transporter substrate-binding protein [Spirochaetia bacterium]|nr:sugar ABC transporter substrate-binding protein [Spirochaetia bacterium]